MTTLYIAPGSPWKNGYNESFNGCLPKGTQRTGSVSSAPAVTFAARINSGVDRVELGGIAEDLRRDRGQRPVHS